MKIVFIIPYFGKFPQWFSVFLSSIQHIKSAHFLIFTDDRDVYSYPDNTKVVYTTFMALQNIFKEKAGKDIYLKHSYKLCDYKPMFGEVFQEYIVNFNYWGYCDLDLIFGDFDSFLKENRFFEEDYDRFSRAGHLTIYKNNERINSLYKTKIHKYNSFLGFEFAKKTTFPTHFDEVGMNLLCYQNNLNYFDKILYGNVSPEYERMSIQYLDKPEILYKHNGKLWVSYLNADGSIDNIELMYVHIMRRPIIPILVNPDSDYLITQIGFFPFEMEKILDYFEQYGLDNPITHANYIKNYNKSKRKKSFAMVWREIKEFPFSSLFSISARAYKSRIISKIKY